jgi:hypothetical protein
MSSAHQHFRSRRPMNAPPDLSKMAAECIAKLTHLSDEGDLGRDQFALDDDNWHEPTAALPKCARWSRIS